MSGFLSTIAAGLQGNATDVLQLGADQVCLNSLFRSSNPMLDRSMAICLPIILLVVGVSKYFSVLLKLTSRTKQVYSHFICNLTVHGSHELNKLVCSYLSTHGIGQNSRSLATAPSDPKDRDPKTDTPVVKYLPAPTTGAWFRFNGSWLKFTRAPQEKITDVELNPFNPQEVSPPDVTLSCFSLTGSVTPIKDFLDHLRVAAKVKQHAMIEIIRYTPDDGRGYRSHYPKGTDSIFRHARKLDSVAMNASTKHAMITTMEAYLADERWYAEHGYPWRWGMLLYGSPGTGKSSLILAVAGHFHIPLVMIGLSQPGMDDMALQTAFDSLPRRCVVLLEDLDSAGIGRESMAKSNKDAGDQDADKLNTMSHGRRGHHPKPSGITLSGLLNAIDGSTSHEGRILICTTNSPDSLDPALVRPGRIDMKILLGNASAEVTESLFVHIFKDTTVDTTECNVAQLARRFAPAVPEDQFTPAEIQNFLLQHRKDPFRALDGVEVWVQDLLAAKSQGGNVASFKGQI